MVYNMRYGFQDRNFDCLVNRSKSDGLLTHQ